MGLREKGKIIYLTFRNAATNMTLVTNVTQAIRAENRANMTRTLRTCIFPT